MKYVVYKLIFRTGVRFGKGMLNETGEVFMADTLFSALCIEALKHNYLDRFYQIVKDGKLLFSDGFPYIRETLYIPKPMVRLEYEDDVNSRKKWKNLRYVPIERLNEYLNGKLDVEKELALLSNLGSMQVRQKISLDNNEKRESYSVGVYYFHEGNGLYFVLGYEEDKDKVFIEELMNSLGYQGIGGKVSTGLGKFSMLPTNLPSNIVERLNKDKGRFLLLSTALPLESEMEEVIKGANYLLEKRSGFIQSNSYSDELVKKQELHFLKSGSVVKCRFTGDVYDGGMKGAHSVWRYAKPVLMEVSI